MALENLMAILNNLVLALIDRLDFQTVPDARRRFSTKPLDVLALIFQNSLPDSAIALPKEKWGLTNIFIYDRIVKFIFIDSKIMKIIFITKRFIFMKNEKSN